ncbi:hypothetical protein ACLI1A_18135 [Flavobacterium sp. RHBU_3]|uniref:hypothetical protein n=1 Tax=Flavobacterium sp. RHBU_3 TaxID=3391184 RepID=UPI0039850834
MQGTEQLNSLLRDTGDAPLNEAELDVVVRQSTLQGEEIADRQQDRKERKKYALLVFVFLVFFTLIILGIIAFQGFNNFTCFYLSDTVLVTLITTSLATVVGIFLIVMRYLFKQAG